MEKKEKKSDKKMDVLKIVISAITIATPLIYLVGLNFYVGILSGYGVSNSLFPFSFEENLTGAYYFLTVVMFDVDHQWRFLLIVIRIVVITIFVGLGLLFIELFFKKVYVFAKSRFKVDRYDRNKDFERLKEDKVFDARIINLTSLVMLIVILPASANIIGKDFSVKAIKEFNVDKCAFRKEIAGWGKCVTIVDNEDNSTVAKGLLIAASEKRIVIYSDNKSRVLSYSDDYELFYEYEVDARKL